MSTEPTGESVLPVRWIDVLERVAQALAQAEAEAARADLVVPAAPVADDDSAWQAVLTRLGERLRQFDDCVAQAGQSAEEVEAALEGSASVLRRWQAEAEAVRARLANGATSSLS
jgi:hypothetical protein